MKTEKFFKHKKLFDLKYKEAAEKYLNKHMDELREAKPGQAFSADMEKVASMQALLADKFLENCGLFWINNKFLTDVPINGPKYALLIHN